MAKQVTLNLKSLTDKVNELDSIKSKISEHAGSQAQRLAAARAAVIDSVTVNQAATVKIGDKYEDVLAIAESIKSAADQALDEAITAHLRKSKDETGASLTALRESFKATAEQATAIKTMLVAIGVDGADSVVLPTLKGTGKVGSSKVANSKGQQFYRVVNGERKDQPSSQNKFSSMAYYFGQAITGAEKATNGDKGCTSAELETFLTSKGVSPKGGTAWVYEVSPDFVVGMDVNETADDDQGDSDD